MTIFLKKMEIMRQNANNNFFCFKFYIFCNRNGKTYQKCGENNHEK